jgi:hypothetical protein
MELHRAGRTPLSSSQGRVRPRRGDLPEERTWPYALSMSVAMTAADIVTGIFILLASLGFLFLLYRLVTWSSRESKR